METVSMGSRSRPPVPLPVSLPAATVQVVPLPVTELMDGPLRPVLTSEKSVESTPLTLSLNVMVQLRLEALEGDDETRLIDETVGAVVSSVKFQVVPVVVS